MLWWKVGIYASIAWILVVAVISGGMMWYISSHPMTPRIDDARHEKAGNLAGILLVVGLVPIWAFLYRRHQKQSKP
jgi:hypothetical protein